MIGKVMKGRGFTGLARYLETGRDENAADRVAWIEARNLPTNDPETASLLMRATASQSNRVQRPVYHVALSFDPEDDVNRETMIRVADRLLTDLELTEHQALIVAHGDTRHAHVHLMVNRVHPETGRAWDPKHDYARIERSLREQERELSLRAVPGHHHQLEGQEPPDRSGALTTGQLRKWERTGEVPFDELVRQMVREDVQAARSWQELEARLAEKGLRLEVRERGLVVTDGNEAVKASSVAPELSRPNLEQRYGAMNGERKDTDGWTDAPGATREDEAGERTPGAATGDSRFPADASRPAGPGLEANIPDAGRPGEDAERDRAERRPHDRDAPEAGRPGHVDADERDPAGADRRDAGRDGRGADRPPLDVVRRTIDALERRIELETTRDGAGDELDRARMSLTRIEAQRAEAEGMSQRFDNALARVYRDPAAARSAFEARAREQGDGPAAGELSRDPERFGELRGTQIGPVRSEERKEALRTASNLEHLGADHLRGTRQLALTQDRYDSAKATVTDLEARVKGLDAELARGPGSATIRHRLERELQAMRPAQRTALHRSLPIPQQRLVTAAVAAGRSFVQEQGHER